MTIIHRLLDAGENHPWVFFNVWGSSKVKFLLLFIKFVGGAWIKYYLCPPISRKYLAN